MARKNKFQSQPNGWMNKSTNRRDRIAKIRESLPITHKAYKVKDHPTHVVELDDLKRRYNKVLNSVDNIISHLDGLVNERRAIFERYDCLVPIEVPFSTDVILQFNKLMDELYESDREYKAWAKIISKLNKPRYAEITAINKCHELRVYNEPIVMKLHAREYIDSHFRDTLVEYSNQRVREYVELDDTIYDFDAEEVEWKTEVLRRERQNFNDLLEDRDNRKGNVIDSYLEDQLQ